MYWLVLPKLRALQKQTSVEMQGSVGIFLWMLEQGPGICLFADIRSKLYLQVSLGKVLSIWLALGSSNPQLVVHKHHHITVPGSSLKDPNFHLNLNQNLSE